MIGLAYSLQNSVLKINWATFQPRILLILAKFDNVLAKSSVLLFLSEHNVHNLNIQNISSYDILPDLLVNYHRI